MAVSAHKCPRAEGGSPRSASFPAKAKGSPCHCPHRQHSDGRLHQQTGEPQLPCLCKLATILWQWTHPHFLSLRVVHVPEVLNSVADTMSSGGPQPGEWRLQPQVVSEIWRRLGRAEVRPVCVHGVDALPALLLPEEQRSPHGLGCSGASLAPVLFYTFPPFTLLQPLLRKVLVEHVQLILVAPLWPHMLWFSAIPPLLDGLPWELPHRRDLLSQANGALFHPFPEGLRLVALQLTVRTAGPAVPPWDLDILLGALQRSPFEPLGDADLKWLSMKTAFLLAVTSARRVSELHALSVHGDCCWFPQTARVWLSTPTQLSCLRS